MNSEVICTLRNASIIGQGAKKNKEGKSFPFVQALSHGDNGISQLADITGNISVLGEGFIGKRFDLTVKVRAVRDRLYMNIIGAEKVGQLPGGK